MDKLEFCSKIIKDLSSVQDYIVDNIDLFYNIPVPDSYPYFPPHDSQSLLIGNVHILLMSAKLQVEKLQEFLMNSQNRII